MAANAFVVWFETPHPWELESELIRSVSLPLNLDQNALHPYHPVLSALRRAAKEQARRLACAELGRSMKAAAKRKREAVKAGLAKLDRALRAQPIVAKAAQAQGKKLVVREVSLPEGKAFFSRGELVKLLGCHRTWLVQLIEEGIEQGELDGFDLRGKGSNRACLRLESANRSQLSCSREKSLVRRAAINTRERIKRGLPSRNCSRQHL